jgi:hypothetical protein
MSHHKYLAILVSSFVVSLDNNSFLIQDRQFRHKSFYLVWELLKWQVPEFEGNREKRGATLT